MIKSIIYFFRALSYIILIPSAILTLFMGFTEILKKKQLEIFNNETFLVVLIGSFLVSLLFAYIFDSLYSTIKTNPYNVQNLLLPNSWLQADIRYSIRKLNLKAEKLEPGKQYDLLSLYKEGYVLVRGNGQSITKIYMSIQNLVSKTLNVIITPGIYLVSKGNYQNMATTSAYTFTLEAVKTEKLGINAVCINANSPIPKESDLFQGLDKLPDKVTRFLQESKNEDPMVIQAGVWTLTDNYSAEQIINHLSAKDYRGNIYHPITSQHVLKAKQILENLGIQHNLNA